jgi:predicted nucleic acid-binding protein
MAGPVYLADTSVYVLQRQHPDVGARFASLLSEGRLAACQMTALEYLNNAPDPKGYEVLWAALRGQRWIDTTADAMERALQVHRMLAARSQHRHFRLPDLIIAATAETIGVTVLHYDADYDKIAEVTGQPVEWIAERGSLRKS